MSRALNINASQDDILAMCAKRNLLISAIEPIHPAGTRVVLRTSHDTAILAKAYAGKIITTDIVRTPLRVR